MSGFGPPTEAALAVMSVLRGEPDRTLGLVAIARRVKRKRAEVIELLAAMIEAGHITRKTSVQYYVADQYSLAPGWVEL